MQTGFPEKMKKGEWANPNPNPNPNFNRRHAAREAEEERQNQRQRQMQNQMARDIANREARTLMTLCVIDNRFEEERRQRHANKEAEEGRRRQRHAFAQQHADRIGREACDIANREARKTVIDNRFEEERRQRHANRDAEEET